MKQSYLISPRVKISQPSPPYSPPGEGSSQAGSLDPSYWAGGRVVGSRKLQKGVGKENRRVMGGQRESCNGQKADTKGNQMFEVTKNKTLTSETKQGGVKPWCEVCKRSFYDDASLKHHNLVERNTTFVTSVTKYSSMKVP